MLSWFCCVQSSWAQGWRSSHRSLVWLPFSWAISYAVFKNTNSCGLMDYSSTGMVPKLPFSRCKRGRSERKQLSCIEGLFSFLFVLSCSPNLAWLSSFSLILVSRKDNRKIHLMMKMKVGIYHKHQESEAQHLSSTPFVFAPLLLAMDYAHSALPDLDWVSEDRFFKPQCQKFGSYLECSDVRTQALETSPIHNGSGARAGGTENMGSEDVLSFCFSFGESWCGSLDITCKGYPPLLSAGTCEGLQIFLGASNQGSSPTLGDTWGQAGWGSEQLMEL